VPITPAQIAEAEHQQWQEAQDPASAIRLIAGPGTGKSAAIERRVAHVLNSGANPNNVYVCVIYDALPAPNLRQEHQHSALRSLALR